MFRCLIFMFNNNQFIALNTLQYYITNCFILLSKILKFTKNYNETTEKKILYINFFVYLTNVIYKIVTNKKK